MVSKYNREHDTNGRTRRCVASADTDKNADRVGKYPPLQPPRG